MNSFKKATKSVLILENDKDLADSIRLYLEDSYRVYTIQDPSQLKNYIKKYDVKLLVTDLDLPFPNLQNEIRYLKLNNPDIKIIVIYMFLDDEEKAENSILQEADDYIFKPFDAGLLKVKLDKLLAVSQGNSFPSNMST